MKKNVLIVLFIFLMNNLISAQEPSNINVEKNINILKSHSQSIGLNFGSTVFYMLTATSIVNLVFPNKNNDNLKLQGNFALDLTYTYRAADKVDINIDTGFYALKTFYDNTKAKYNGNVYAFGLSAGARFYFNKKDRASGFFLMPKLGATLFFTKGKEEIKKQPSEIINKDTLIYDIYVSGEIGFRIDLSRSIGINEGVRPFLDISILDIGYSYNHIIRFVPLPRFAIGILF